MINMTKQYWMKIINSTQLSNDLLSEYKSGMAWKSMEKIRSTDDVNVFSTFNGYSIVQKGDEMLFKIKSSNTMYKAEVMDIDWGNRKNRFNELVGEPWVHIFKYTSLNSIGKRELWKNKDKLQFLTKFTNPGLPFMTGMWKLPKEDFEMIVNDFK